MNNEKKSLAFFSSHVRAMSNASYGHSTKQTENSMNLTTTINRHIGTDSSEDMGFSRITKLQSPGGGNKNSRNIKTELNLPEIEKTVSLSKMAASSDNFHRPTWTPMQRTLKLPSKEKLSNLLKMEGLQNKSMNNKQLLISTNDVELGESVEMPMMKQVWNVFEEKFKLLNHAEERKFFKEDDSNVIVTHKNSLEREINNKRQAVERMRLENMFSDKKIIDLKEDVKSKFYFTQMDFYYFSIPVKNRFPPVKIWFKPSESDRIKILLSRTTSFPSKFNCEKIFEQTKFIKIKSSEINKNIFTNDHFYFSIVCEVSQFVSIKYSFRDEDMSPKAKKIIYKMNDKCLPIEKISSDTLFKTIKEIQRKRKEKMLEYSKTGDKIQANKQGALNFIPEKVEMTRKIRKEERQLRMNSVVFNKTLKEQEEFQHKNFSIYKHEINKTLSNIQRLEKRMKGKTIFCATSWKSTIKLIQCLVYIDEFFKTRYKELQRKRELFFRLKIFVIMFRAQIKKRGPTLYKRTLTESKLCITRRYIANSKTLKEQAEKVIVETLKNNIFNYDLEKSGLAFHKKVILLKTKWRDYIQRIKYFKETFKRLWDKYYVFLILQLSDSKFQNVINDPKNLKRISVNILKANDLNSKDFYAQKYFSIRMVAFLKDLKEYRFQYNKQTVDVQKKMKVAELFVSNHIEVGSKAFLEQGKKGFGLNSRNQSLEDLDKDELKEQMKGIQVQIQQENQKKNVGNLLKYPRLFIPPSVDFFKECVKEILDASPNKKRLIYI